MPAEMIEYGAKALKPFENYVGNYLKLYENLDDPRVVEAWRHEHMGNRQYPDGR